MNGVDVVVIAVVGVSAIIAFLRGFVREMLTVGSWIGAAFVTVYGLNPLLPHMEGWIANKTVALGATVAVLFIGSLIVFSVISHQLAKFVQGSALSAVDRSLGVAFGVLRGAILVSLAYLLFMWFKPDGTPMLQQAKTLPMMEQCAEMLKNIVPSDLGNRLPTEFAPAPVRPVPTDAKAMAPSGMLSTKASSTAPAAKDGAAAAPTEAGYGKGARDDIKRTLEILDLARDAADKVAPQNGRDNAQDKERR
jgi:membrane protein required for colicin V production